MNTNTDSFDDRANDEADRHAQMMRKQREGRDGKQPTIEIISVEQFKEMLEPVHEK